MLLQLGGVMASLTESDIGREQLAVEEAIKKIETQSLHHLGAPTEPSVRLLRRPSRPVKDLSGVRAAANDIGARSTEVDRDENRAGGNATFARKLAFSKPGLSVELEHRRNQIRHHNPRSSIARKLVPITIMAFIVFAAAAQAHIEGAEP